MSINPSVCFEQIWKWKEIYSGQCVVIKFGGALAEDPKVVEGIAKQICYLQNIIGINVIAPHGGGKQIDKDLKRAGLEIVRDKKTGLRITDKRTVEVSDASLRNLNNDIVCRFNAVCKEVTAMGCSGYDGPDVSAVTMGSELGGYTGHLPEANVPYFERLMKAGVVPFVYPICQNRKGGGWLNVNADNVAGAIAVGMQAKRLIICSDVEGVLDEDRRLIQEISPSEALQLIDRGVVAGGMIPKLKMLVEASKKLMSGGAVLLDGRNPTAILDELLSDQGGGTLVRHSSKKLTTCHV